MPEKHAGPSQVTADRLARLARAHEQAHEAVVTAREALAAAIHEADTGGWPLREIARACDVHQIAWAEIDAGRALS